MGHLGQLHLLAPWLDQLLGSFVSLASMGKYGSAIMPVSYIGVVFKTRSLPQGLSLSNFG